MDIEALVRQKKFTTLNQAYYWFDRKHPEVNRKDIKQAFNATKVNKYVRKYNKSFMGNLFSPVRDSYQMDIYFTARFKTPWLLLININSRYGWAGKLRSKNTNDVLDVFAKAVDELHPKQITADEEKSFNSYRFIDYCKSRNIKLKTSLAALHSEMGIMNRFCRTLRSMTGDIETDPDIKEAVKHYNKRFHESIKMAPRDLQFDTNAEYRYIYDQLSKRDKKKKLLLDDENQIKVHDKVRYILDEKRQHMGKNEFRYNLSKYYYLVEHQHSPFLFDIIAKDGSVKTIPRYRLYKLSNAEAKLLSFAPTVEDQSNMVIYDEILDYKPVMKRNGQLDINKSKYIVREISRDELGKKIKKNLQLGIKEVRIGNPTELDRMELEFLAKNKSRFTLDSTKSYLVPKL